MTEKTRSELVGVGIATAFASTMPFLFTALIAGLPWSGAALIGAVGGLVGGPGFWLLYRVGPRFFRKLPAILAFLGWVLSVLALIALGFLLSTVAFDAAMRERPPWDAEVWSDSVGFLLGAPIIRIGFALALFAVGTTIALNLIGSKIGPWAFRNWVLGRYHRPREVELVFMFLDLRDSTALAERMGAMQFSRFVQDFFRDLTEPLVESRAQVSHYIGDEAVIFWRPKDAFHRANVVRLVERMEAALSARRSYYEIEYEAVPRFKAGAHLGVAVAAEVGQVKSELVFHGDVLNTTARIVGLCDGLSAQLLISADLASRLEGVELVSRGAQRLKGKSEPIEVFEVVSAAREAQEQSVS